MQHRITREHRAYPTNLVSALEGFTFSVIIKRIHGYARRYYTNTSLATKSPVSLSPQLSEEWLSHRDISLKTRNHSLLLPIRKTAWSSIPNHSATTAFVSLFYRHTHEATGWLWDSTGATAILYSSLFFRAFPLFTWKEVQRKKKADSPILFSTPSSFPRKKEASKASPGIEGSNRSRLPNGEESPKRYHFWSNGTSNHR